MTAFISGHTDLSVEDFAKYYHSSIDLAIQNTHKFVMGNAPGVDTYALEYLLSKGVDPKNITVYVYNRGSVSENVKLYQQKYNVNVRSGFNSYSQRDATMTIDSTYDIAYVRTDEQCRQLYGDKYKKRVSGAQQNINRRNKISQ